MKEYIIFAGVNGAGKSTFYNINRESGNMERINTDEIVRQFGNWSNPNDVLKAGKIAVERISEYFRNGVPFNQETTLCGKSIIRNIKKAKELGYRIELYFVGLDSAEIAKERIAHRVTIGGHGIPDKDVERRYVESLENFKKVLSMVNVATVYDNTKKFRQVAVYINGNLYKINEEPPEWFKRVMNSEK